MHGRTGPKTVKPKAKWPTLKGSKWQHRKVLVDMWAPETTYCTDTWTLSGDPVLTAKTLTPPLILQAAPNPGGPCILPLWN